MNKNLCHPDAGLIRYGIREVMDLVQRLSESDPEFRFIGENIGDPIAKGWRVPGFVKDVLKDLIYEDDCAVFGYAHSRGRVETREWVARHSIAIAPEAGLSSEDVIFFNGLGAGIGSFYRMLAPEARVLQPLPGYPAHLSAERFASGSETIGYRLDPRNGWQPDLEDIERQIASHPEVRGILLVNPNNPTGSVYSGEILEKVVQIAERHGLILISDEIYFRMVFNGAEFQHVVRLAAGRVPLVVMRGMSKDIPWPGSRCGWMEFYNLDLDKGFQMFFEGIKKLMTMEVGATHMAQAALPLIYEHPEYPAWNKSYNDKIAANSNVMTAMLAKTPGITVNPVQGAFYMTVLFNDGVLNQNQSLSVSNVKSRSIIEEMVARPGLPLDKRFACFLLASTGICVVPLSDFECSLPGFRVTALERDLDKLNSCYKTMSESITKYLNSTI